MEVKAMKFTLRNIGKIEWYYVYIRWACEIISVNSAFVIEIL